MKTLSMHRTALDRTARHLVAIPTVRPEIQPEPAANNRAAIERQLDEIQHTFSVRWEW